ncbi:hypothetical protein GGD40_003685 [Paraburkholderia bryophila]|uniref:Uncharacterized protein n=1 Tax=Paraburkholderia bryophila TaxID=420952 RepID=A0A7Y9WNP0_9BURK|nr:hypothetical protein [Paraburkholderia bryophila]
MNVNGAARNGVSTSGASVVIGAGIETTPEGATSEESNLRLTSNESWSNKNRLDCNDAGLRHSRHCTCRRLPQGRGGRRGRWALCGAPRCRWCGRWLHGRQAPCEATRSTAGRAASGSTGAIRHRRRGVPGGTRKLLVHRAPDNYV